MMEWRKIFGCLQLDYNLPFILINQEPNLALTAIRHSNHFFIQMNEINPNDIAQLWSIKRISKHQFLIINLMCNKALAFKDDIILVNLGINQSKWLIDTSKPKTVRLKFCQKQKTWICNTLTGLVCKTDPNIQTICSWKFKKCQTNQLFNKTCFIQCYKTKKYVTAPQQSSSCGSSPTMDNQNNSLSQRFWIYKAGDVYIIKSLITKLNLDIYNQINDGGVQIIQWPTTGGFNQMWVIQQKYHGIFRISSLMNRNLELGHDGDLLFTYKGNSFLWKIIGNFIQGSQ